MANERKRSRLRLDLPDNLIRATRAKAAFAGIDVNMVIADALEKHLVDELAIINSRKEENGKTDNVEAARNN